MGYIGFEGLGGTAYTEQLKTVSIFFVSLGPNSSHQLCCVSMYLYRV